MEKPYPKRALIQQIVLKKRKIGVFLSMHAAATVGRMSSKKDAPEFRGGFS